MVVVSGEGCIFALPCDCTAIVVREGGMGVEDCEVMHACAVRCRGYSCGIIVMRYEWLWAMCSMV